MMNEEIEQKIINSLPYTPPFLFVNSIIEINEKEIRGLYQFKKDEFFYRGHFTNDPVTPGVILLEVAGQIGLICFGIYLLGIHQTQQSFQPLLSHVEADFMHLVYPEETVTVHSQKIYFRNNTLKCHVEMKNETNDLVLVTEVLCKFKLV